MNNDKKNNINYLKEWSIQSVKNTCEKISLNKIKIKQKDYLSEGKYPVIDQGHDLVGGYSNDNDKLVQGEPPFIIFGDHTKIIKYINFKFIAGADGVKVLKPKDILIPKLFYYFLHSIKFEDRGYSRHYQFLEKKNIPIPPRSVQEKIVEKIDELFSELDNGVEELKKVREQLKVYRQSVLSAAFSGKLTNKNLKNGELPKGWKKQSIKELCEINPRLPFQEIKDDLIVTFLPMKRVEEVSGKIDLLEKRKYSEVKKGYTPFTNDDIIFAKITPCMENGKIAIVSSLENKIGFGSTEFHVFRCKNDIINKYLFYFLIQEKFRNEAKYNMTGAVGQKRVPKSFLENFILNIPDIIEQQKIVNEIETRLSVCDKMEETIDTSLAQSESLRQSILKQAFEGKLVN